MNGFDTRELTQFQRDLLDLAARQLPKESKQFLRKEGVKLKKLTTKAAKRKVKKKTGNLFRGIRTGKVYIYRGTGALSIRVYAKKPAYHAGLINNGHRKVNKKGEELGFVEGSHFFEESEKDFKETYFKNTQDFIDEMLERGLS